MVSDPAIAVRMAARALGRAGLVHAYGHCSVRLDDGSFLVCPPRPMSLIAPGEPCSTVSVSGALPVGVLGEVRIHQKIYAARPSAGSVIRFMSPSVMALAALGGRPQMRHGFGTYFAPEVGLWDDIQLIRDDARASGVVDAMGESAGVLMRGNGAVVSGGSIKEALMLAWYLEDMCRIELAALACRDAVPAPVISAEDAAMRATFAGGIVERMWEYLTAGDPERSS
jgi:HCOMODA/2-hydroxy-3-carboxy-muconic semialdehyde decarboxylase